jgi:hypothetical protein
MPSAKEIREQVARESRRRERLAVPAFGAGILYYVSSIIVNTQLSSAPTVGLVQGLTPALRGEAQPAVSPRAAEVKYISDHAFGLIAGSAIKAFSLVMLVLVLLLLIDATRFRRPDAWPAARPLVLFGGILLAIVTVVHQIASSIQAHNFAVGHDLSNSAVEHALTQGTVNVGSQYLDLLAALALTAGMIGVCVNTIRVGLLPRWMGVLGMFAAILIFIPIGGVTLEIIPAFWLLGTGILFWGRWPGGDPPAWPAGEARPWPTPAERRESEAQASAASGKGKRAPARRGTAKAATGKRAKAGPAPGEDAAAEDATAGAASTGDTSTGAGSAEADTGQPALTAPPADQDSAPAQGTAKAGSSTGGSSGRRRRKRRVRG